MDAHGLDLLNFLYDVASSTTIATAAVRNLLGGKEMIDKYDGVH